MSNRHPHFAPYNLGTKHICESVLVWTVVNNNLCAVIFYGNDHDICPS